ncbi:adenylate/guanylate cyclase domain-containing protein [Thalassospira marina]|uniref:Adenylate cyclase n=1 Tax=Thalassospira marina TaxID=2048283 RepID=A0A2N3KG55_9PROT|nr:adenylate/guanylate cyclase domain-containing protein [Thalassospira marina]PKR49548.1 adenylate cyclase [Thalassospira marina]
MWNHDAIIAWLGRKGRTFSEPLAFLNGFGDALLAEGCHIDRIRCGFGTIHPQMEIWSYLWKAGEGASVTGAEHGTRATEAYIGSPAEIVFKTGRSLRLNLQEIDRSEHHSVIGELIDAGFTDYIVMSMTFAVGSQNMLTFASKDPAGFGPDAEAKFARIIDFFTPIVEMHAVRRLATGLLDTYLGPRTGARVLNGLIKRGDGEVIRAALWFSDLRDFTLLTETLSTEELLESLNCYFETVEAAVLANGGEILRFIGDAMLIVFAPDGNESAEQVCQQALAAARQALSDMDHKNIQRGLQNRPQLRFGVGLHYGEVVYGNVGGQNRLDFTVMGVAVNRTARLESLTKQTGRDLLMSDVFAAMVPDADEFIGKFAVKGVADELPVHALIACPRS